MKCRGMHSSAMCNKSKQTNSIKTSCKASHFTKYSPYVRTPLLNVAFEKKLETELLSRYDYLAPLLR
jgi:hypothetical protein